MNTHRIEAIAIGTSAGGIDALFALLEGLPVPSRAALIAVIHLPEGHESRLPDVFGARLGFPVTEATPGALARPGQLHFAPAGYHLLVEPDRTFSLSCDSPVLFSRPSIDVLFASCADAWGPALAGLVMTGANEDGAAGLSAVRAAGGLAAVQDPVEAAWPDMPLAAIAAARPQHVLPLAGLRRLVLEIACP